MTTNKKQFADLLQQIRDRCLVQGQPITSSMIASAIIGSNVHEVQHWLEGSGLPKEHELKKLADFFRKCTCDEELDGDLIRLFELCNYAIPNWNTKLPEREQLELKTVVEQIREEQREQFGQMLSSFMTSQQKIETLVQASEGAKPQPTSREPAVIWVMPEEIEITMVRADILSVLDDLKNDENQVWAVIGVTGGAVLGIVVNWLTSSLSAMPAAIFALFFFIAATGFLYIRLQQLRKRIDTLRREHLEHPGKKQPLNSEIRGSV